MAPRASSSEGWKGRIIRPTICAGMREFVRAIRGSEHDDLVNSAIGGFGAGALLCSLPGRNIGALRSFRSSIGLAVIGTSVDYFALRLRPPQKSYSDFFIQVLDEEALAAKQAREEQFYAKRATGAFFSFASVTQYVNRIIVTGNYISQFLLVS
ncbi:hypothetical protein HHK36_013081 [Tetracentron sinense]|uniref:Uncharacterized protein n=1 Tax=Tetracentron sinense TaxID=13715 RepID=A0A834Z5V3_TETSI|nr:hypothetical protein HHK36_013081 [Tetracentron sinense]